MESVGRRKLKSEVVAVTLLRLELLRSETVCVELRRSGEVELERRLAWLGVPSKEGRLRSSKLHQLERGGLWVVSDSSLLMIFRRPRCLRVGFRFGFSGRGSAPGGKTAGSGLLRSMVDP